MRNMGSEARRERPVFDVLSRVNLMAAGRLLPARWAGFDYGETAMDPRALAQRMTKVLQEIFAELKRPEVTHDKISLAYKLAKQYGEAGDFSDFGPDWFAEGTKGRGKQLWQRIYCFKQLLHKGMEEFYLTVLDDDPRAIEAFRRKRMYLMKPTKRLKRCLRHLREKAISINIISDAPSESEILEFLNFYNLQDFFDDVITPAGCVKRGKVIDLSYRGRQKIDGAIYEKLVADLRNAGISAAEAVIVGDRPIDDIKRAKEKGLTTVQFTGVIDRGSSDADYVISDLAQLEGIL